MKSLLFQVDEEMEKSLFLKATQIFMELENRIQSKPEVFQKIKVFHDIQVFLTSILSIFSLIVIFKLGKILYYKKIIKRQN